MPVTELPQKLSGNSVKQILRMHQHECSTCDPFPVTRQPKLQDLLQIDAIKLPKSTFPKCIRLLHVKIQEKQWAGPLTQQAPHAFQVDTNRRVRKLVTQINIGVMYAQCVDHPIPDQYIVDTFIMVIMKCGLFNTSYEKWHAHPDRKKTWAKATVF